MLPAVGVTVPAMQRRRVVLPEPFGPRIAIRSPAEAPRSTFGQHHVLAEAVVESVDLEDGLHGRGDRGWHPIIAVGKTRAAHCASNRRFDVTNAAPGRL